MKYTIHNYHLAEIVGDGEFDEKLCPFSARGKLCGPWCIHFSIVERGGDGDDSIPLNPRHMVAKLTCGSGNRIVPLDIAFDWSMK